MNTTKVAQKNHIKLAQNYSRNGSQVRGPRSGSAANSGQSTPCNSNVILNQAHLSASGGSGSSQLYPMARNGSAQIFNFQYGQGKRDSINSNGSNGQRLNSLCNQEANNTKALSHKLLERMNILQSHLDVIGQNTAIHEPQFRQFYSKFEEQTVNMFSQGQNNEEQNSNQNGNYPIKKHKETLVGLKKEDYDKLMRDYNELKQCLCSSKSTLDKQVNDLTSMANDVEQHVVYQQEQQGILIKDLELRLKGHFIQQTQQLDKLIDSDYQELMSQYIEIMEDQIDQEYQENEQQISLIEQCINQIEEENDQRLQQIENILNDLDDLQLQQQSQNDPLKEQLQNWMSSQICQFQQNFDRELQGYYQKKVIMLNEEHQIIQEQLRSDIKQAEHKLTIRQSDTHSIQINQQQELSSRSSSVQTRLRNASQQKENQQDNQQNRQSYNSATRESNISSNSNKSQNFKSKIQILQTDLKRLEQYAVKTADHIGLQQEQLLDQMHSQITHQDKQNLLNQLLSIKKQMESRKKQCENRYQDLQQELYELLRMKKQTLDGSNNINKTLNDNRETFQSIEYINEHMEVLQKHISNTQISLVKQINALSLQLNQY